MNSDLLWTLLQLFVLTCALAGASNLFIKWRLWRKRKEWESDDQIVARHKEIKKTVEGRGQVWDVWKEASAAIARRDWNKGKKTLEMTNQWGAVTQWGSQLGVVYFAYRAYDDNDLRLFVLLAIVFLWRSINYQRDMQGQIQVLTMARLHMANPTAEDDFFKSEHCYGSDIHDRVWTLLNKEGYFPRSNASPGK